MRNKATKRKATQASDRRMIRRIRGGIAAAVGVSLIAGFALLGYSGSAKPVVEQKPATQGTLSPVSFGARAPSKEFIYAGGRLVAQDEPQSCVPLLVPNYQSFPATPSPNTGSIGITIGTGCNWSASSNVGWITFPSGNSGTGSGSLTYAVATNTSGSVRSGIITVAGQIYTVYQGKEFADVPTNHIFYSFIGRLAARGVTGGYATNPPTFGPDDVVPHEQMATFVMRARGEPNPPTPPSQRFADVPPINIFYAFIDRIAALGIWNGCPNGLVPQQPNYCPSSNVTREQMAAIIIRGIGELNPPTPPTQRFTDVPPTNQYYNFIDRMAALGITSGCTATTYCPTASVTRGQMAVFLVRAFNL